MSVNICNVFRAVATLNMAIDCTKTTAGYSLDLRIPADRFMLDMAVENKICAQALQRDFYKLR